MRRRDVGIVRQGRGRIERVFATLQNRLPQELRLARIKTLPAANRYVKQRFVPDYNARFAVPAEQPGSAFVPYVGASLQDVLCIHEDRRVGADNCVIWKRRSLQIPTQGAPAPRAPARKTKTDI